MICTAAKYYYGNQVKKHKVGGACDIHGQKIKLILGFVGKPETNSLLQRPGHRRYTVTMDLQKNRMGGCGLDSSDSE